MTQTSAVKNLGSWPLLLATWLDSELTVRLVDFMSASLPQLRWHPGSLVSTSPEKLKMWGNFTAIRENCLLLTSCLGLHQCSVGNCRTSKRFFSTQVISNILHWLYSVVIMLTEYAWSGWHNVDRSATKCRRISECLEPKWSPEPVLRHTVTVVI